MLIKDYYHPIVTVYQKGKLVWVERGVRGNERIQKQWRTWESNPVPIACEAIALPYELDPRTSV